MSDEWDFYFSNVNNVIASLFVDFGIRDSVPDPKRPWLLWTWVYFRQGRDDGLSSSEESSILGEIEDSLTEGVKEVLGAELVGRITTAGRREFFFYGPKPDRFESVVLTAMKSFPQYKFDTGINKDPDWTQYLTVLYPSPEDNQRIKNRHVVEALEKHGDPLTESRAVSHWIYFKTEKDRDSFSEITSANGFNVVDKSKKEDLNADYPFGVTINRVDHVDWDSINKVTIELFRMARQSDGDYDGWETSIEKSNG